MLRLNGSSSILIVWTTGPLFGLTFNPTLRKPEAQVFFPLWEGGVGGGAFYNAGGAGRGLRGGVGDGLPGRQRGPSTAGRVGESVGYTEKRMKRKVLATDDRSGHTPATA